METIINNNIYNTYTSSIISFQNDLLLNFIVYRLHRSKSSFKGVLIIVQLNKILKEQAHPNLYL